MTSLLFCSFLFTVNVSIKQKAGYEKNLTYAAFCLRLSWPLVSDSEACLIFNEELHCMSTEVEEMVTNGSVSGTTFLVYLYCLYRARIASSHQK